jgi:hypothetical protein
MTPDRTGYHLATAPSQVKVNQAVSHDTLG